MMHSKLKKKDVRTIRSFNNAPHCTQFEQNNLSKFH